MQISDIPQVDKLFKKMFKNRMKITDSSENQSKEQDRF